MMYVDDEPNLLDVPDVCNVIDVPNFTDVIEVISILDITDVPDVTNVSDDSHDFSPTSDISQVTATGEKLTVSHNVDTEYDANDPVLLSSSSSSFPRMPPSKPLYPKQLCHINLHDMSAHDFLQAYVHEVETEVVPDDATTYNPPVDEFNAVKGSGPTRLPPDNTCQDLSKYSKCSSHLPHVENKVSYHTASSGQSLSLIDRGVNDIGDGIDMRAFFKIGCIGNTRGFDTHQCSNIGAVGGVIQTHKGSIIRIIQSYTMLTKEPTIHSPCQFEWYENDVKDKSIIVSGGLQCIQTVVGCPTPLNIKGGLTHLSIDPNTDHKWDNLPHVIRASELEWDPSVLDHDIREDEQWGEVPTLKSFFDEIGDNPVFYDAHETELGLTPEANLPGSTPSGPCVLKWWFVGLTCLVLGYI
jgi:hypothetical protein